MKYFKMLGLTIALMVMAACSGSTAYSPEACKTLQQKIENKETLTEGDYDTMITQLQAIAERLNEKKGSVGGDEEAQKKFAATEGREMFGYVVEFGVYLSHHSDELSPANVKKFEKVSEEFNELKE